MISGLSHGRVRKRITLGTFRRGDLLVTTYNIEHEELAQGNIDKFNIKQKLRNVTLREVFSLAEELIGVLADKE